MTRVDTGDTAWMLAATALVLLMTPALGLFYAGLVRARNTLNTYMMSVAALCVATIMWALVGYSIAFGDANGVIGGFDHLALHDVTFAPRAGTTIPQLLFMAFQATFCIVTVALVSGAIVERMAFGAYLVFIALWSVLVYAVLAHWAFGGGWLQSQGTLDFAGGVPVEMGSGFSALAAALVAPVYAFGMTFLLLRAIALVTPLRTTEHDEAVGMDIVQHGEEAYATGEGAVLVAPEAGVEPPIPVGGPT